MEGRGATRPGPVGQDAGMGLERLNGDERSAVVEERAVFSVYCSALGLPVPRLLAILDRRGGGRSRSGRPLRELADWLAFLAEDAPDEIVITACTGDAGRAARMLSRRAGRWEEPGGGEVDEATLWRELGSDPELPAFVVEERLANHPEIERLGGGGTLHALRIVTLVERSGEVSILWAAPGLDGLDAVPEWQSACDLVRRAAPHFLPLRSLAWDVGLTPDGPVIVDASARWSPPPGPGMAEVLERVRAA
jgi:hypothetical protein